MNIFSQHFKKIKSNIRCIFFTALALSALAWCSFSPAGSELEITFQGLKTQKGTVRLAVYDSEKAFMDESQARLVNVPISGTPTFSYNLNGLAPGKYALAFFQDENDNFKLDKNLLGIPTEPYGFSKTPESKWRVPDFEEIAVKIEPGKNRIAVQLKKWQL